MKSIKAKEGESKARTRLEEAVTDPHDLKPKSVGAPIEDVAQASDDFVPDSLPLSDRASLVGNIVADRYRVKSLLGEGSMGAVYQAEHIHMRKDVALKVLHDVASNNPELVARFEREAIAAGKLHHPGIVSATDFGALPDGSFYLALELIRGVSLAEELKQAAPFSPERALRITEQINGALCAAHAQGIVHRDLKPENIMLVHVPDEEDFVKVLDFGIAKIQFTEEEEAKMAGLTQPGLVFGTPEYMSPEQAMGQPADERSDLYSLGIILFEMLSGTSPFQHDNITQMLTAQITEQAPPLPSTVPKYVHNLVKRLLRKNSNERPASADILGEELSILFEKMAWPMSVPRTSNGMRIPLNQAPSRVSNALHSVRTFSMAPISIGSKQVPRWIPFAALGLGLGLGALFMLRGMQAPLPEPQATRATTDIEGDLLHKASKGDRDALADLRKVVAQQTSHETGFPARQVKRFFALAEGYHVIQLPSATLQMYEEALKLDPSTKRSPALIRHLKEIMVGKSSAPQALQFTLQLMGTSGTDILYDIFVDYLGKNSPSKTIREIRSLIESPRIHVRASSALRVALSLHEAKYCHELRSLLPDAALNGDARSLPKLKSMKATRGCGKQGLRDCYQCLRKDMGALDKAIQRAKTIPGPPYLPPGSR